VLTKVRIAEDAVSTTDTSDDVLIARLGSAKASSDDASAFSGPCDSQPDPQKNNNAPHMGLMIRLQARLLLGPRFLGNWAFDRTPLFIPPHTRQLPHA
jgi:hypothetical protein